MSREWAICPNCGGPKTWRGKHCQECYWGTFKERLWLRIDVRGPDDCWPWKGHSNDREGRGRLLRNGHRILASRAAYEEAKGPIPPGLLICHACDNPPCCNPAHLFIGTHSDNLCDAYDKRRLSQQGVHNPFSKLDDTIVREIRRQSKFKSLATIGRELGVDISTIWKIVHRVSWKHVETRCLRLTRPRSLSPQLRRGHST